MNSTPALAASLALAAATLVGPAAHAVDATAPSTRATCDVPQIMGHRGASAYRPEHTFGSYELAAEMGADFIEPDVVSTKDGHLVVRHEPEISGTTDVAQHPEFADRKTTKNLDGTDVTGWFTTDFTLAELRTLRAVERLPENRPRNTIFNGRWQVPTLDEVLTWRKQFSAKHRRTIGVIPELKHSTWHAQLGLPLEKTYLDLLTKHGLNSAHAPIVTQSFEVTNLKHLREDLGYTAPSVFLVDDHGTPYDYVVAGKNVPFAEWVKPERLKELAQFVTHIAPYKTYLIPHTSDGTLGAPTTVIRDAHAAGLSVNTWTFRPENAYLPAALRIGDKPGDFGHTMQEIRAYLDAGLDSFFTDAPDIGALVVNDYLRDRRCPR